MRNISFKAKFEEFDEEKSDLKKEETKVQRDVDTETSQKRDYVPTAEEEYYRRLADERLPTVVTRNTETVNAFKTASPWVLIKDFDIHSFDHTPFQDMYAPAEKRTLDEGTIMFDKGTCCIGCGGRNSPDRRWVDKS